MKVYLTKMKSIYDTLVACAPPIFEEDQVLSILAGLWSEFEPITVVITSKVKDYS